AGLLRTGGIDPADPPRTAERRRCSRAAGRLRAWCRDRAADGRHLHRRCEDRPRRRVPASGARRSDSRRSAFDGPVGAGAHGVSTAGLTSELTGSSLSTPVRARRHLRRHLTGWLFLAPAVLMIGVFTIVPFFQAILLSFQSWDGVSPDSPRVGLDNYRCIAGA